MNNDTPIIRKGAKVRFLDAVGGGTVTGFRGKDTVLVEDENGFEIPVLPNQIVVVDEGTDDRMRRGGSSPKMGTDNAEKAEREQNVSVKKRLTDAENSDSENTSAQDDDPASRPVTFRPRAQERKGGNKLNVYLCFEPVHEKDLGAGEWNMYVVNDSNYFFLFNLLSGENSIWMLRHTDTVEPNTTLLVETVSRDTLNELQHLCAQMLFFKEGQTFTLKAPASIEMRLDLTRFYKWHLYEANDFFLHPVLTLPLVKDDRSATGGTMQVRRSATGGTMPSPVTISLDELRDRYQTPAAQLAHKPAAPATKENEVVDLHIDALLDNTRGLSAKDMLDYQIDTFRKKMEEFKTKKGKHIVFIHGKGEGVLRSRIISILRHDYPRCVFQDASFREYGFGATMVIIR